MPSNEFGQSWKRNLWESELQRHEEIVEAYETLMARTPKNDRIRATREFLSLVKYEPVDKYGPIYLDRFETAERLRKQNHQGGTPVPANPLLGGPTQN